MMVETHLGNEGFMYSVFVEEDFIEEFKTPAKARKEAREQEKAFVEEKGRELSEKFCLNHTPTLSAQDFILSIIKDCQPKVSKKRIRGIQDLLVNVANGDTGVILASARIRGWLMEAGVEVEG